jgi:hypothetical protein
MMDKPVSTPIERARIAGAEAQRQYPGGVGETWRAIKGYEQLVELGKHGYSRAMALGLLDPNRTHKSNPPKPTLFDISERHIRRVETIAKHGKLEVVMICTGGAVSLETAEHMVIHSSTEMIEVAWLAATPAQREEFLRRRVVV